MVNLLGKTLVFVNLALSVMFVAFAVSVYVLRIDVKDRTTSTGEKIQGKITERADQIKQLLSNRDDVVNRYQGFTATVSLLEKQQADALAWYADQLRIMETGRNAKNEEVADPIRALVYDKGAIKLNKAGTLPELGDPVADNAGKPLKAYAAYVQEIDQAWKDIAAERLAITKLVEENKAVTEKINGLEKVPGLRAVLAFEQLRLRNALLEQDYLDPLVYNRQVEVQLVLKRQEALRARLKELEKVQGVDTSAQRR